MPEWGDSPYYTLRLRHDGLRLQDVLTHLYVLLPVLDNDKHYYVDQQEAEKLLHRGGDWLPQHPERGFITRRYLRYLAGIVNPTLARLLEVEEDERTVDSVSPCVEEAESSLLETGPPQTAEPSDATRGLAESTVQPKLSLHDQRLQQVAHEIYQLAPQRVLDLGCGEGKLLRLLLRQPKIDFILGMDVSHQALSRASGPPASR